MILDIKMLFLHNMEFLKIKKSKRLKIQELEELDYEEVNDLYNEIEEEMEM